jgi:hypothetical protein
MTNMTNVVPATRLRVAGFGDAVVLAELYRNDGTSMQQWLEHGGALLVETAAGELLGALRWRQHQDGWWLEHPLVRPAAPQADVKRWLLTKVEALAIVRNVPALYLDPPASPEDARIYARLGYHPHEGGWLRKPVGGTWQVKR